MTKMEMAVREQKRVKRERKKNDFHGTTSDMCVVFSTRQKIDTIKASFKL